MATWTQGERAAERRLEVGPSLCVRSMVFHFTHDAGQPGPNSTKELHISTARIDPTHTVHTIPLTNDRPKTFSTTSLAGKLCLETTDFGEISSSSDPKCKLAVDILVDRMVGFVGSYYVKLAGKIDALVFAGGIGENGTVLRTRVVQ